ncbi:MAG TPA: pilus assembly protein PilM, partial [Gemmataceae bacterium]|nr:pilus assembly protein PilM [Gemmataceae bacterium]
MSRFLAIDADAGSVHVVAGVSQRGTVRVERAVTFRLSAPLTPTNAADLGRELKEAFKAAGLAPAPVLAALGRDRVILKDVKIPRVPAHEEPAVVRFQASKDATEAAENVVLDYYTLDREEPDGQVRAVTVSVRKDVVAGVKAMAQAAGVKLAAITTRPPATLAALDRAIQSGDVTAPEGRRSSVAVVTRGEKWGELLIARDGQVVFARAISAGALTNETMLLGELRRNLAVYNGQTPQQPVEGLYVAEAAGPAGWAGRIRAGLTVPVQAFDPLAGLVHDTSPDDRGHYAPLVGLLHLKAKGPLPIDFVTVRQPAQPVDRKRQWKTLAIGLAVLLVFGGLGFGYLKLQAKNREMVAAVNRKKAVEEELVALELDRKRMATFQEWDDGRINWLDEFYDITAQFPDKGGTRLEYFKGDPRKPEKGAKSKLVGQMKLKITTETPKAFTEFQAGLRVDKHYQDIVPTPRGATRGGVCGRGQPAKEILTYELKLDLERLPPGNYFRTVNAAVPSKPARGRGDDE